MSDLLKKRLEAKKNTSPLLPSITVNIPPITFPQPQPPTAASVSLKSDDMCLLVPSSYVPGPKMLITDFCTQYELDSQVHDKLLSEGYRSTASLEHATIAHFTDAGFKRGEIAEMKVAIARWAVQNN